MIADLIGEMVQSFTGLVPDRQPWRGLMLALFMTAVVGAVLGLLLAAGIV